MIKYFLKLLFFCIFIYFYFCIFKSGFTEGVHSLEPPLSLRHSAPQNESNLGLSAVINYQNALDGFLPLYKIVQELSPQHVPAIAQGA